MKRDSIVSHQASYTVGNSQYLFQNSHSTNDTKNTARARARAYQYLEEKQAYHQYLQNEGIEFHYNRRIHAKLLVVDKRIAVIPSMNFIVSSTGGSSWEAGMISIDEAIVKSVTNTIYELLERID